MWLICGHYQKISLSSPWLEDWFLLGVVVAVRDSPLHARKVKRAMWFVLISFTF